MTTHIVLILAMLSAISVISKLMDILVQLIVKLITAVFLAGFVLLALAVIVEYVKLS